MFFFLPLSSPPPPPDAGWCNRLYFLSWRVCFFRALKKGSLGECTLAFTSAGEGEKGCTGEMLVLDDLSGGGELWNGKMAVFAPEAGVYLVEELQTTPLGVYHDRSTRRSCLFFFVAFFCFLGLCGSFMGGAPYIFDRAALVAVSGSMGFFVKSD